MGSNFFSAGEESEFKFTEIFHSVVFCSTKFGVISINGLSCVVKIQLVFEHVIDAISSTMFSLAYSQKDILDIDDTLSLKIDQVSLIFAVFEI